MAEKIFTIKMNADDFIMQASAIKKKMVELRAEIKNLEKGSPEWVQKTAELKKSRKEYNLLEKQIIAIQKQQSDWNSVEQKTIELLNTKAETIAELEAQNKALREVAKSLNLYDEKQRELLDQINKKIAENIELKRQDSDVDTQRIMNIGNYKSVWDDLDPRIKNFMNSLDGAQKLWGETANAMKGATTVMDGMAKAVKSIKLSVIIIAIEILISILLKFKPVANAFKVAWEFIGLAIDEVMEILKKFVEAWVKGFKAIMSPIETTKKAVSNLGTAFKNLSKLNFKGFVNAFKDFGNELKKSTEHFKNMYDEAKKIVKLEGEIKNLRRWQNYYSEKTNGIVNEYERLLKNTNISLDVGLRYIASEYSERRKMLYMQEQQLKKELEILKIKTRNKEMTEEEKDKYAELLGNLERVKNAIDNLENEQKDRTQEYIKEYNERQEAEKERQKQLAEERRQQAEQELNDKLQMAKRELEAELELFRLQNADKLKIMKNVNNKTFEEFKKMLEKMRKYEMQILNKRAELEKLTEKEKQAEILKIKQKYIDLENAYASKVTENELKNKKAQFQVMLNELQSSIDAMDEASKDNDDEQTETDKLNERLAVLQNEKQMELDVITQALHDELITTDEYKRRLFEINQKYGKEIKDVNIALKRAELNEKKALQDAEIKALKNFMNLAGSLFGKSKGLAIAQAVIDTYVAANQVLSAKPPLPAPLKIAEMISIITVGLKNIAEIQKQKAPAGIGGGDTTSTSISSLTPNLTIQSEPADMTPTNVLTGTLQSDTQNTVQVVNVAADTIDRANDDLMVENLANF